MRWLAVAVLEVLALGLLWRGAAAEAEVLAALGAVLLVSLNALLLMWGVSRWARKPSRHRRESRKRNPPNGELELSRKNFNYYVMDPTDGGL